MKHAKAAAPAAWGRGMESPAQCIFCGQRAVVWHYPLIHAAIGPLRRAVLEETLFTWSCAHCGQVQKAAYTFHYMDAARGFSIVCRMQTGTATTAMHTFGLEQPVMRCVNTLGEAAEKIRLLEAGLDDRAVEVAKAKLLWTLSDSGALPEGPMEALVTQVTPETLVLNLGLGGEVQLPRPKVEQQVLLYREALALPMEKGFAVVDRASAVDMMERWEWL